MIKAIIFDFDGVIVNSEPLHDESTDIVLKNNGINISQKDRVAFLGLDDKTIFTTIIKQYKIKKSVEALIQEREQAYFDLINEKGLQLFPGVLESIQKFSKKYQLAIATSSEKSKLEFTLKKFNLQI